MYKITLAQQQHDTLVEIAWTARQILCQIEQKKRDFSLSRSGIASK